MSWSSRHGASAATKKPAAGADLGWLETVYRGAAGSGGYRARRVQRRAGRHRACPAVRRAAAAVLGQPAAGSAGAPDHGHHHRAGLLLRVRPLLRRAGAG